MCGLGRWLWQWQGRGGCEFIPFLQPFPSAASVPSLISLPFFRCTFSLYMYLHAAGRIRFINLNQAAGQTKFCWGPDLARGPDFGYAWHKKLKLGRFREEKSNFAWICVYQTCVWSMRHILRLLNLRTLCMNGFREL